MLGINFRVPHYANSTPDYQTLMHKFPVVLMPKCPHCGENAINPLSKFWSDAACPACCQRCGGLAYLESSHTQILNAIVFPGSFMAFVAAAMTNSPLPMFGLFAVWLLALARAIWRAPLTPISAIQAASNKRARNVVLLASLLGVAIWWWVSRV